MQSHRYEYKIAGDTSNHDDIRIHVPSSKLFTMVGDLPLMHLDKALWFSAKCIVRTKCLSSKEHMPQFRCTSFMLDHLGCYLSHGTTTPTTQHSYGIACKLRTCMLRCSMQTLQCLQCTRKNIHPKPKALKPTDIMRSFLQWWVLALRMYNIYMLHYIPMKLLEATMVECPSLFLTPLLSAQVQVHYGPFLQSRDQGRKTRGQQQRARPAVHKFGLLSDFQQN